MLDIDKIRANIPRDLCGSDVAFDKLLDLAVGEHLRVARDVELFVEDRMPVSDARLHAELIIRLAEATRMRELKADHQVIGRSIALLVCADENLAKLGEVLLVLLDDDELVR